MDDCSKTISLLHSFYSSDEKSHWVLVNNKVHSDRLGRPDETISNLYRTPK
jgi:UDP-N-acetyl-2-amino-2-deoxyglucuronate dehydrogenase